MNSGMENSAFREDKLPLNKLKEYLPSIKIIEEKPLTAIGNYIIVWGNRFDGGNVS